MVEKLNFSYKVLKPETAIIITSELKETSDLVSKALSDVCELTLKQPLKRKKLVLMTDASSKLLVMTS